MVSGLDVLLCRTTSARPEEIRAKQHVQMHRFRVNLFHGCCVSRRPDVASLASDMGDRIDRFIVVALMTRPNPYCQGRPRTGLFLQGPGCSLYSTSSRADQSDSSLFFKYIGTVCFGVPLQLGLMYLELDSEGPSTALGFLAPIFRPAHLSNGLVPRMESSVPAICTFRRRSLQSHEA